MCKRHSLPNIHRFGPRTHVRHVRLCKRTHIAAQINELLKHTHDKCVIYRVRHIARNLKYVVTHPTTNVSVSLALLIRRVCTAWIERYIYLIVIPYFWRVQPDALSARIPNPFRRFLER